MLAAKEFLQLNFFNEAIEDLEDRMGVDVCQSPSVTIMPQTAIEQAYRVSIRTKTTHCD